MISIKKYASKLVSKYDYDLKTRRDLRVQYIDHISNLKAEYMDKGFNEEEATKSAINSFCNDGNFTRGNYKQKLYVNSIVKNIMIILFVLSIAVIAIAFLSPLTKEAEMASIVRRSRSLVSDMHTFRLIPFKTITMDFRNSDSPAFFIRILLFIPLGIFIPFAVNKYFNIIYVAKICAIAVILVQLIKVIFPVGFVSIDDVILNFIGCLIGLAVYRYIILNLLMKIGLIISKED